MIQEKIKTAALNIIAEKIGKQPEFVAYAPVSGGCINYAGKLTTTAGPFFIKYNSADRADMFRKEIAGLETLAQNSPLGVPSVRGMNPNADGFCILVLQWVEQGKKEYSFWENLGHGLAQMHQITQQQFGFEHDNYIGSLPQFNKMHDSWIEFFIEERIEKQLKLAEKENPETTAELRRQAERMYTRLPEIFPDENPALLHGDLWSGNFLSCPNGQPVLVDPAVYYGHREMEIAFTGLFGGFSPIFYDAYNELNPLAPGFQKRKDIYNLYSLLVHYNLFGRGYLTSIKLILKNF